MEDLVRRMTDQLNHRGPDDSGVWVDPQIGLALGHRRLSIVDLSQDGHQPMFSESGRYVTVFNGEVYNFVALRQQLAQKGHRFRGHSDTEAALAAIEEWGLEQALTRFNGMFAFALWDARKRELHLVRDRLGEKPLYYGWAGRSFLFGSELKAFRPHPDFRPTVDRDSLAAYLRHNCVPAPCSIYHGIRKLLPGTRLCIKSCKPGVLPEAIPYWSAVAAAQRGLADPYDGSDRDAVARLDTLLRDAVKLRTIADVPLGAFLSGGIDSSTIVALMQQQNAPGVRTFSIGFTEEGYDETENACAVARHLGTDHTSLYVSPREAREVIPLLPTIYDEPFSDSSQIPTYIVSKLARRRVTVVLSGDGGDELFGGYRRYFIWSRIWEKLAWLPKSVRKSAARALCTLNAAQWNRFANFSNRSPFRALRVDFPGDKIRRLAQILAAEDSTSRYRAVVSACESPEVLLQAFEKRVAPAVEAGRLEAAEFCRLMMCLDVETYLPDDILAKIDRASMAVALETRVPYLDHRVAEFAARLPLSMKIRRGTGKWLLRRVLEQYVPARLTERPKKGFSVPITAWLRGPLRAWAEELLGEDRLGSDGFFHPGAVRSLWNDLLHAKRDVEHLVWSILMFQAWLDEWNNRPALAGTRSGNVTRAAPIPVWT